MPRARIFEQVVAYSEKTLCLQGKGQKGHKQTRVLQASLGANVFKTHQRKYTSCYHFLRMMWGVGEDVKLDFLNLASSWGVGDWGNHKIRVKKLTSTFFKIRFSNPPPYQKFIPFRVVGRHPQEFPNSDFHPELQNRFHLFIAILSLTADKQQESQICAAYA